MALFPLIDVEAAAQLAHSAVLLDCRFDLGDPDAGRRAYAAGHIPGAHHADLNRDLSAAVRADTGRHPLPDPAAFASYLAAVGVSDDTPVIVYDGANGSWAARAWWLVRWLGHDRVALLDGGLQAWVASGRGTETGDPSEARGRDSNAGSNAPSLTVRLRAEMTVATRELVDALAAPGSLLIDARAAERYSGAVEPIDPVAGHVPGAVNHPFTDNLDGDGHFLPAAVLRRRWLERLCGIEPGKVALMCGSGVTACHNALAMELAGLSGARLYAGSWSEWIRDPARVVARGLDH